MFLRIAKISLLLLSFSLCYIQPFFSIFNFQIPPTEFIFLIAAAFWIPALISKQTVFRFHKFFWLLLFYFAAMLTSAVFSGDYRTSFIKLAGEIYLLSLPVLIYNLTDDEKDLRNLVLSWLSGTFLVTAFAPFNVALFYFDREHWLLSYTIAHYGAVPVGHFPRLRLNFLSPSLLCNYLSVSFSLLMIALKLAWINRTQFLIITLGISFTAIFTISSGLGGFPLIFGLWIFYLYHHKNKRLANAGFGIGVILAFAFWIMNFIALQPHSTAPYSFEFFGYELFPSPRLLIWQESFRTFKENFLIGRGVGMDSCEVLFENTDGSFATLTDAHNVFLSTASQEGIFGFISIALIICYLIKKNLPMFSSFETASIIKNGLLIAFISAFVYQGLVGSFEDSRHLWVLIGLMLCADKLNAHRSEQSVAHLSGGAPA